MPLNSNPYRRAQQRRFVWRGDGPGGGTCYRDAVLADNPIAYWRLGESVGPTADDAVGTNDGTYVNSPTLGIVGALGDPDTAVTFATTHTVTVASSTPFEFAGTVPFSVEAWFKHVPDGTDRDIVECRATGGKGWTIYSQTAWIGWSRVNAAGSGAFAEKATPGLSTAWHHMVATYDGTSMRFYLDGTLVAGPVTSAQIIPTGGTFLIGNAWNGSLDEVAIYNAALTATQVNNHFAARAYVCGPATADETNAAAELAAGTGSAGNASASLEPNSASTGGTGAAGAPTSSVQPPAQNAAGAGAAQNANGMLSAGGTGVAAGTGAAGAAGSNVQPNAGHAAGTGAAANATTSVKASASVPGGTGTAYGPSISEAEQVNLAQGTGAAGAPTPNVLPNTGNGAGTGAAYGITEKVSAGGAGVAAGTGVAGQPNANVAPNTGVGSGAGAAPNLGPSVAPGPTVAAGTGAAGQLSSSVSTAGTGSAAGTGTGQTPAPKLNVSAGVAAATGAAYGAAVAEAEQANLAQGAGTAYGASIKVAASAGVAQGAGTAYGLTTTLGGSEGVAQGAGAAGSPGSTVQPHAGNAAAAGVNDWPTYPQVVTADSPVAYWRLGETTGTVADDAIGTADATYFNAPTLGVAGAIAGDTAVTFARASTQYAYADGVMPAGSSAGVTIEGWARFDSVTSGTNYPIARWWHTVPASNDRAKLHYNVFNSQLRFTFYDGTTSPTVNSSAWTPTVGVTYHIVASLDPVAKTVSFYVNGAILGSPVDISAFGAFSPTPVSGYCTVARGGSDYFDGTIDEVAIYNSPLSAARVQAHYGARTTSAAPSVAPNAQVAAGLGAAYDPGIELTAEGEASAQAAEGVGAALDAHGAVAISPAAGEGSGFAFSVAGEDRAEPSVATGSGAAAGPYPALQVLPGGAAGSGAAFDATATITGATYAQAETADGSGEAFNPTIAAVSVVSGPGVFHGKRRKGQRARPPFKDDVYQRPDVFIRTPVRGPFHTAWAEPALAYGEAYDANIEWDDDETALALLLAA